MYWAFCALALCAVAMNSKPKANALTTTVPTTFLTTEFFILFLLELNFVLRGMARILLLARNTKTLHGEQGTIDGRLARGFCAKKGMNGSVKRFGAGPGRRGVDLASVLRNRYRLS